MGTRILTKKVTYIQPASSLNAYATDGIYVDDFFFKNAVPILSAKLKIVVKPTKHLFPRGMQISTNIYRNGNVEFWPVFGGDWGINSDVQKEATADLKNWFYGMGLNLLYVTMVATLPFHDQVVYTVNYLLEVTY